MPVPSKATPLGRSLPRIVTRPPGPASRRLAAELAEYESPAVSTICAGEIPIVWRRALGANVEDADGNIYIDLTAGFGVANLGHADPAVTRALRRQSRELLHGLGDVHPSTVRVDLVRRLAEIAPGRHNKVILCNTGAEAVEVAMKTATLYTGKSGFLAFERGFHGQSYGALAVTSREEFRRPFESQIFQGVARAPFAYCHRCPVGRAYPGCDIVCLEPVERLLDEPPLSVGPIGAVIVEPVQGREGEIVPPPEWLPRLKGLCVKRGVLLIVDEMITGFGRTGEWFAVDHWGVEPDLMCVGKALANGLPVSACIGRAEVMDAWRHDRGEAPYSSTFMANPLGGAAALAALDKIERTGLPVRARRQGSWLIRRLRDMQARKPIISDVRGLGMMIGLELVKDRDSGEPATEEAAHVAQAALEAGVILLRGGPQGNVLSITPPLVITRRQLAFALEVLEESIPST